MSPKQILFYSLLFILLFSSCSRKHVPETANAETHSIKTDSAVKRTTAKRKIVPKIIVVNDNAAKKSVDGRLYYDLDGHRYWKNYNDGKYYLFSQSMYSNKAFEPRSN